MQCLMACDLRVWIFGEYFSPYLHTLKGREDKHQEQKETIQELPVSFCLPFLLFAVNSLYKNCSATPLRSVNVGPKKGEASYVVGNNGFTRD